MANRRSPDPPRPSTPKPIGATARHGKTAGPNATPPSAASVTAQARRALIELGAYLRAERRGFAAGCETEDWLAAEAEVDTLLKVSPGASSQ